MLSCAEICAPWPCGNRDANFVAARRQAHLTFAEEHQRPDVAFGELVDPHDVGACLEQFLLAVRDFHLDDMSGVDEAADMLAGAEDCRAAVVALVASHPFENREAVVQAVGQDVNGGLIEGDHRAVHPDSI